MTRYAAALDVDAGRVRGVRLALGGVAHKPWRDPSAEALLNGRAATEANFEKAADMVLRDAKGYGHNDFKLPLVKRTLTAVLTAATRVA